MVQIGWHSGIKEENWQLSNASHGNGSMLRGRRNVFCMMSCKNMFWPAAITMTQSPLTKDFTSTTKLKHDRITTTGRSFSSCRTPIQEQKLFPQRMTGSSFDVGFTKMVPVVRPCSVGQQWQAAVDSRHLNLAAGPSTGSKGSCR
jgi:hypothetical protein